MALPEQPNPHTGARRSGLKMAAGIGLIIGIAAGFGGGYYASSSVFFEKGYDTAREELSSKLTETGFFLPVDESALQTTSLMGEIKEVREGSIILGVVRPAEINPLLELDFPLEREVRISDSTNILKRTEKSPEEIEADVNSEDFDPAAPPEPFYTEIIDFDGFKPGDTVTVTAEKNIFSESRFEAKELKLLISTMP